MNQEKILTPEEKKDDKDFPVCNHCYCLKKDDCKRYNMNILSSYDFAHIYESGFNCFIRKDADLVGQM